MPTLDFSIYYKVQMRPFFGALVQYGTMPTALCVFMALFVFALLNG
jgi:hypothetical protein